MTSQLPASVESKLRRRAKSMFLSGYDIVEISGKLDIPIEELRFAAFGENGTGTAPTCWHNILKQLPSGSILPYLASDESKLDFLSRGAACCADIMVKTLGKYQAFANDPDAPAMEPKELAQIAKIYKTFDDVVKEESGKRTHLPESIRLTFQQQLAISKALGEDQLMIDAEYEEMEKNDRG